MSKFKEKEIALAMYNNTDFDSLSFEDCEKELGKSRKQIKDGDYDVYDDKEANDEWEKVLNNYLEKRIYSGLAKIKPELCKYFDARAWRRDAKKDGRKYCLSRYYRNEYERKVNGTTYYIYYVYRQR